MLEQATQTWQTYLATEKEQPYFQKLWQFIKSEQAAGKQIYPPSADIFNTLVYTPFKQVKVVILGQDPYHQPNQAHGLAFSVQPGVMPPPSLKNIFAELKHDLGIDTPKHGCLTAWAKQGVLLLNTVLTVEAGKPQSHTGKGWEQFTDKIIQLINQEKSAVVFLLWGSAASKKAEFIDQKRHHILSSAHPSPLSTHRGFLGCRHFSKTNALLEKSGQTPIDWRL